MFSTAHSSHSRNSRNFQKASLAPVSMNSIPSTSKYTVSTSPGNSPVLLRLLATEASPHFRCYLHSSLYSLGSFQGLGELRLHTFLLALKCKYSGKHCQHVAGSWRWRHKYLLNERLVRNIPLHRGSWGQRLD